VDFGVRSRQLSHECHANCLGTLPSIFTPDSNEGPSRLDVDAAIGSNKLHYSLLLPTPGHSDQAIYLDNLALSTQDRFEQQDVPSDLDEAIEVDRAALLFSLQD
jgi:hypothetical protein